MIIGDGAPREVLLAGPCATDDQRDDLAFEAASLRADGHAVTTVTDPTHQAEDFLFAEALGLAIVV